ncbi:hypothetical protein [Ideonella dechloratans]|uniref:hypothetical protein n=1 Tax=Ideonella dechloratans TaxID=36863 RepID=UPI0035B0EB1D
MTKTATARAPAPSRAPFLTRTPRPDGLPEFFLSVRQAEAAKLGLRAHGNIVYQVLLDPERQRVFLRVVANSGSGSFSDEPVLVDKLARAVADRDRNKPLRGSELQSAILGKSVCNSGFMAAVLVTEGLLGRNPAKRFDLLDLERWQTWTADQLATPGELTEVRLKAEGIDPAKDKLVAVGKVVKGKGLVIEPAAGQVSSVGVADDAPPATEDVPDAAAEATAGPALGHDATEVDHAEAPATKGRRRGKGKE